MSKLICAYGEKIEATRKCDFCDKLLCKVCGYIEDEKDYCNECWKEKLHNEAIKLLASEE